MWNWPMSDTCSIWLVGIRCVYEIQSTGVFWPQHQTLLWLFVFGTMTADAWNRFWYYQPEHFEVFFLQNSAQSLPSFLKVFCTTRFDFWEIFQTSKVKLLKKIQKSRKHKSNPTRTNWQLELYRKTTITDRVTRVQFLCQIRTQTCGVCGEW